MTESATRTSRAPNLFRRLSLAAITLAAVGASAAAGCSVITSYDGFTDLPPCGKHAPPAPPGSKAPGKGDPARVAAIRGIRFTDRPGLPPLGLDLDYLCTCPGPRACKNARTADDKACDGPPGAGATQGIDNSTGVILSALLQNNAAGEAQLQDSVNHGKNGLAIRVQDWNGKGDDPGVTVGLMSIVGLKGDTDGGAGAAFDGNDEFLVDFTALAIAEQLSPYATTTSAWVAGNTLVANFEDYKFRIAFPTTPTTTAIAEIPLKKAQLVGRITAVGTEGFRLDAAQLVGTLAIGDVFTQVSRIGLCRNDPRFPQTRGLACSLMDLSLRSPTNRSAQCDAMSFAMGFEAAPAKLAGSLNVPGVVALCGDEIVDRCQ